MIECLFVGIGGFTTFSTFALEVIDLIRAGSFSTAVAYILLSIVLGQRLYLRLRL